MSSIDDVIAKMDTIADQCKEENLPPVTLPCSTGS